MRIHYTGAQGGAFGWGVFGENIVREFRKLGIYTDDPALADCIFNPVDSAFRPLSPIRGKINVCLNFFESPLEPFARENAAKFGVCFVGSTWCQRRCAEAGIHNTRVLIQGVDGEIFKPQPQRAPDGTIRIFSGGKFEFRKGHDLVIAAFRKFLKTHPNAHLVCAWHNPWPQLIEESFRHEICINRPMGVFQNQETFFHCALAEHGIPMEKFTILPQLSQRDIALEMANTDFGIFPNRCEGGNNLVLQEYLSTGRWAAANIHTGHADLFGANIIPIFARMDANHWAVQDVSEIVRAMESAASATPQSCALTWTWEAAAQTVIGNINAP